LRPLQAGVIRAQPAGIFAHACIPASINPQERLAGAIR